MAKDACPTGATIAVNTVDAQVWAWIESILTQPEVIAQELEKLRANDPTQADLTTLGRQLSQVERQRKNLVGNLGMLDPESAELVRTQLADLSAKRTRLLAEREEMLARRQGWELAQERLGDLQTWCRTVAANVAGFDYDQKRLALDALGVKVTVARADRSPRIVATASLRPGDVTLTGTSRSISQHPHPGP